MIFGETGLEQAEGAILAHSLKAGNRAFKKGRVLSADDIAALRDAGFEKIVAARLETGDVHEDAAATAVAEALIGDGTDGHIVVSAAFTGRCNLVASVRGLLALDHDRLEALNLVHEAITVATLAPHAPVEPRQMLATVKIIPFAVPKEVLDRCLAILTADSAPVVRVAAFRPRRAGLIQTRLDGTKESVLDKTKAVIDARLAGLDCMPAAERRCHHDAKAVARAIGDLEAEEGVDLIMISGASAIVDRRDVIPAGIEKAGGAIDHFGMPVDPGNLILLAHHGSRRLLGLPGCARSPKLNGLDWVLQRIVADLSLEPADIMRMGAGGLLKETGGRPLPRAQAVTAAADAPCAPRIAALVLAAGQSRRMGQVNKLLIEVDGKAMVRRVAEAASASAAAPLIVVTGHERATVEAALSGLDIALVHNADYPAGLSSSLHRGLAAVPADCDGVLVCLGDMPRLEAGVIDRLIAAFDPVEGRAICVPTWQGKRGNPVLFATSFVAEIQAISGDVGARHLLGEYPEAVVEVPMPDEAVLVDIDTPENLAALGGTA